ncbi:SPOR domain-containing protein [Lacimicrobium sp. SS2-24]|uniref:SPOR domain-containing protein n=1 Tax=Lacimicrobium sp. SS2-24 TaxID=2005569 RepID=UPI000B4BCE30|nr:SPOR domain-containing protein [Lacimicrobium sp. SS2-24]
MQTAFIDLEKRLLHLTSFVGGLILLAGTGASKQQRFLRDFVSDLDESVNIAFLNAGDVKSEQSFRQQLLSQLFGAQRDARRPLHQQVAASELNQGRIVIAVSQARQLPTVLVDELWMLSSRSDNLSIVLAADTEWAMETKQQLQGGTVPVLLQYDFPESTEIAMSELDRLLAEKRQAFNARLAQRQQQDNPVSKSASLVTSTRFKSAAALVFVISFGGLIHWFHPELVGQLLPANALAMVHSSLPPEDPQKEILTDQKLIAEQPESSMPSVAEPAELMEAEKPLAAEAPPSIEEEKTTTEESAVQTTMTQEDAVQTVTQWSEAVQQLKTPAAAEKNKANSNAASSSPEVDTELADTSPSQPENEPVQSDYAWDEAYLLTLPDSEYVLQLSAASDSNVLEAFIHRHELQGENWRYQTQRYGGDWHVLLLQGSYPSLQEARSAANTLPLQVRAGEPFAKTIAQIRKEISSQP